MTQLPTTADVVILDATTRRMRRRPELAVWLTAAPLVILALVSFGADLLPLASATKQDLLNTLHPPMWMDGGTAAHPLGTDNLGRDELSRLIYGGRLTFVLGLVGTLAGLVIGVTLGLVAGFLGGKVDIIVSRLIETQFALPAILLAMSIVLTTGRSLFILVAILALLMWATYARLVRAEVLALRGRPFVKRLTAAGVPRWRMLSHHMLPNVGGTIAVIATLEVGSVILTESSLSFLGLGVIPPEFSWGTMLAEGRERITTSWWLCVFPGLMIFIVVILVNLLGDAVRAVHDPRRKRY